MIPDTLLHITNQGLQHSVRVPGLLCIKTINLLQRSFVPNRHLCCCLFPLSCVQMLAASRITCEATQTHTHARTHARTHKPAPENGVL